MAEEMENPYHTANPIHSADFPTFRVQSSKPSTGESTLATESVSDFSRTNSINHISSEQGYGSVRPDWSKGVKFDQNKPRMDLLDSEFLEDVGRVLTFGAAKYDAHNWRSGINYSRLIAAAMRHLSAINRGEDTDPESGLPHTAHLGCCVQFLHWMMKNRPSLDDRWKDDSNLRSR